ncbi:polyadenylate-binding protein-interacting protein 1 [Gouania willdenowi]|uniref:Polyadenylate-binding protein-interacting protein 1 n=1 Tax=Gouania willdenowi TaxID=441366 RepID=A0A8C5H031_GOUWI|nr:polyadenylate-binding protein-interacting protein 1 [Gouania willdenowi]
MNNSFDRAPGAGRNRDIYTNPGLMASGGVADSNTSLFHQREPLRQPRTVPPYMDSNAASDYRDGIQPQPSASGVSNDVDSVLRPFQLSATAAEFVPSGFVPSEYVPSEFFEEEPYYYESYDYYEPTLAEMITDFLSHLSSSPGTFDSDVEGMMHVLNSYVTTEELLHELVELIYTQSTNIPNFSYTGARLCNYLSQHLAISPSNGNFRQLLLQRCRTEYEQRDEAVRGDAETQKRFHSFVLFLGELYLHLEIKSSKGTSRANILLLGLRDLLNSLLSTTVDANLICAIKLLKLTGSVLDDAWKESNEPHMDDLVQRIKNVLLDAACSRDARQMLLKLVELRSSDWGRVRSAAAASNATPDNDPNYFMNEPTFYTEDGTPFTAADPDYAEKYQELMEKQDYFHEENYENENELSDLEDEMEPEIEEAYEKFCLETEKRRQQQHQ